MALEGIRAAPGRRGGHRRLADGARPGHPDLLRPGRRHPRRGAVLRRRARHLRRRTRRRSCTWRWTTTGWSRRRCARRCDACAARGSTGSSSSTRSRTSTTRPASRWPSSGGREIARDLPPSRRRRPRGQPVRPARLRRARLPGAARRWTRGRDLPRLVLQDLRARACGSAGCWRRTRCARSWCWPPSRRCCARRRFNQMLISRYLAQPRLARPDQDLHRRSTAERRDAMLAALETHMPAGTHVDHPGRRLLRLGDPARGRRHRRRCCRARSPPGSPTCPGTGFYADGLGSRQLRLSYCYPTPERIREGVRRLAGVLEAELDVHAHLRQPGAASGRRPGSAGAVAGHRLSPPTMRR